MQAVLNDVRTVKTTDNEAKLDTLLKMLIDADQKTKSEIENRIVNMGEGIANLLVDRLQKVKGTQRGVIAMSLIRLGECSIAPLKRLALESREFQWIANYLISEIQQAFSLVKIIEIVLSDNLLW